MTAVVILTLWLGLGCLTWALFAAVVRGNRMTDAEIAPRPDVELPAPRIPHQPRADAMH